MNRFSLIPFAALALGAAFACGGNGSPDVGLLARAGDQTWPVDEAASLLAPTKLPADREAVRALAEIWIDYSLLAGEARADSTLAQVDVSPLVGDLVASQLIASLRDSVIEVTPIGNDELIAQYRREAPGSAVRARQILLRWPSDTSGAAKDSLRHEAEVLRASLAGGADFAKTAAERSQDPATAAVGGKMGIVARGQMLPAVDSALFSIQPGKVSQPVASPYGLHLLLVEEKVIPSVAAFRGRLMARRAAAAESIFIANLESAVHPRLEPGAPARVRDLARHYRDPLPRGEASRPLLRYDGGSVTEGEVLWYLQSQPPALRPQIAESSDDAIAEGVVRAVEHQKLLQAEARREGLKEPDVDHATDVARANLVAAARQLGLLPIVVGADQRPQDAVHAAVATLLGDMLSGKRREVTPLEVMSYVLRRQHSFRVVDQGLDSVVARVQALRKESAAPTGG